MHVHVGSRGMCMCGIYVHLCVHMHICVDVESRRMCMCDISVHPCVYMESRCMCSLLFFPHRKV